MLLSLFAFVPHLCSLALVVIAADAADVINAVAVLIAVVAVLVAVVAVLVEVVVVVAAVAAAQN